MSKKGPMSDATKLVSSLFQSRDLKVADDRMALLDRFLQEDENKILVDEIMQNGTRLMTNWKLQERVADIVQQPLRLPNATVGKTYEARIDRDKLGWQDLAQQELTGIDELGLRYDATTGLLSGVPIQSGDRNLVFRFRLQNEAEETPLHEKPLLLIINPDPKSLWKNIESDRNDPFWKEDNATLFAPLGDRHLLVSSKRGRSHANVGSFREDDFSFAALENGWNIVVVADGAGSAKLSRKGSAIACGAVVDFFKDAATTESMASFDGLLAQFNQDETEEGGKAITRFLYNTLGKAAFVAHKKLEEFAKGEKTSLKDLSATLVFCLWKKYEAGYAFLSFGVGDCPMAVLNKDLTEVALLNWLDVGEYGGGTRFITMPEIFKNEKFATRFNFKLVADFGYLVMMSDGIYDPKFVVEAALPKLEKWKEFFADLNGNNPEGIKVEMRPDNKEIEQQFSQWMDFWSPGNHDDRTLAIVF